MKILIVLAALAGIVLTCIFTPKFLREQRTGKSKKSIIFKMICATSFVLVGFMSAAYSTNGSQFARFMLIGLALSWVGDLLLGFPVKSKIPFAVGFVFFMGAHVMYIANYTVAMDKMLHGAPNFTMLDVGIIIGLIVVGFLIFIFGMKMKFLRIETIPMFVYSLVLMTMLERASMFAVRLIMSGGSVPGAILVFLGALSFTLSDYVMGPLCFGNPEHKKNYPLKCFNIWTYFGGQLLLALSLIFVVL